MAEIQKTTNLGAMTQRFIEFVMMQSQHAALFLGQIANPQTGEATVNLEAAKMFIDQLEMVREKTRGNLTSEEERIINSALGNLQAAFLQISSGEGDFADYDDYEEEAAPPPEPAAPTPAPPAETAPLITSDTSASPDSKKRFSKSYGS